ncbi:MAG: hypothetical protein ACYDDF_03590 [Thermoplasmatota archaeon]
MRAFPLVMMAVLVGGCMGSPVPPPRASAIATADGSGRGAQRDASGDASRPSAPTGFAETTIHFGGIILLRPAGSPILFEGDNPEFSFEIPPNASALWANATWTPSLEPAGLELHHPGRCSFDPDRVTSWRTPLVQTPSPATLKVVHPAAGTWCGYFGPGSVGGGMAWNLTVTFAAPQKSNQTYVINYT